MGFWKRAYEEVGLHAFIHSSRDIKILCLNRFVLLAGCGTSTLILVLYLLAIGNSAARTGLFMTLTLFGDACLSIIFTMVADKIGRRKLLMFGSLSMTMGGLIFASVQNFWVLLFASIFGVISPSGKEVGPFKAIEESMISQLIPAVDRSAVLAWYMLHGTAGVAVGTILSGWTARILQDRAGFTAVDAYRTIFVCYAAIGIMKFVLCLLLTENCELQHKKSLDRRASAHEVDAEREPLLRDAAAGEMDGKDGDRKKSWAWLPKLTRRTALLLLKLGLLFSMDSIASGLATPSWLIYFFSRKFGLAEGTLGTLFFVTNIVSSASNLGSSALTRRIGLIPTMIFTHAPAAIALALIPLPSQKAIAVALLIFRASINSMDQAPRQAFLAAAVQPEERTTVMGIVNFLKTLSQAVGPIITGKLANAGKFWVALVLAGALKIAYNIGLLVMFWGYRTVEDEVQETEESDAERPTR